PKVPAKPSRLAIALLGLIAAIVIGLMSTVLAEGLDSTVRGTRDIRAALNEIPLSAIPKISNSISKRRRSWQAAVGAISLLVGVPVLYFVVLMVVR
ncbi:MAG: hypothetical protein ACLQJ0_03835, partial [Steroidobacteraceae bacterium]